MTGTPLIYEWKSLHGGDWRLSFRLPDGSQIRGPFSPYPEGLAAAHFAALEAYRLNELEKAHRRQRQHLMMSA